MTLIDKAEALLPCPFCGGEAEWKSGGPGCAWVSCKSCPAETGDGSIPRIMEAWNRRALPARGVGVNVDAGIDALEAHLREIGYSDIPWREWPEKDQADVRSALRIAILAALAPTDAAQAREAALAVLAGLSSYLGAGLGDDTTTPEQYDKRIRWAIDDLAERTRRAALREAALEMEARRLHARLWAIGHAAGIETKEDLMRDACDAIGEART